MAAIKILAGARAYKHIQQHGLAPQDISAVFGASGAAKWLTIYGLDRAIFCDWLSASDQQVDLFGTSVGAFKLAACAQSDPGGALLKLANAYIDQDYEGKDIVRQVIIETRKVLDTFLSTQTIAEVLANPRYNYHCGSVRALGDLASDSASRQKAAMVQGFLQSLLGKSWQQNLFERVIFHPGKAVNDFHARDKFSTHRVALSSSNFYQALLSSGSIPVIMPGVRAMEGAPEGIYRDGGLLDYHAIADNVCTLNRGLVLYPHFYTYLKEGWFDKFWPWRRVSGRQLESTVLIGPSDDFVQSLPGARIPERQDFTRFRGKDQLRVQRWTEVRDRSMELGEAFLQQLNSGDIAGHVELMP